MLPGLLRHLGVESTYGSVVQCPYGMIAELKGERTFSVQIVLREDEEQQEEEEKRRVVVRR